MALQSRGFDPDSSVDIEIGNGVQVDIEVTLTIDDYRRGISIPAEDQWLSEDIIDDGERPTITVATKNLEARLQWKGERNNRESRFSSSERTVSMRQFAHKFCSKFTLIRPTVRRGYLAPNSMENPPGAST